MFPKLNPRALLPHHDGEAAAFYLDFANVDAMECVEWQLAERGNEVATNPFLPLTRCYGEHLYPFSLGPEEVVLFSFA
jgi:hypothetical protein